MIVVADAGPVIALATALDEKTLLIMDDQAGR